MAEHKYDPEFQIEMPWDTYLGPILARLTNFLTDEFEVFLAILAFIVIQLTVVNIYYHIAAYVTADRPQQHVHVLAKQVVLLIVLLFVFWYPTTDQLRQLLDNQAILGSIAAEGELTPAGAIWLLAFIPAIAATLVAVIGLGAFVVGLTRYQASWEHSQMLTSGPDAKALILRGLAVFAFCFLSLGFQFVFYMPEIEVVFAS